MTHLPKATVYTRSGNVPDFRAHIHIASGSSTDASHVLFFKEGFIGVAARAGNDTYPHLINWESGEGCCLSFTHNSPKVDCPVPIASFTHLIFHVPTDDLPYLGILQSVDDEERPRFLLAPNCCPCLPGRVQEYKYLETYCNTSSERARGKWSFFG